MAGWSGASSSGMNLLSSSIFLKVCGGDGRGWEGSEVEWDGVSGVRTMALRCWGD